MREWQDSCFNCESPQICEVISCEECQGRCPRCSAHGEYVKAKMKARHKTETMVEQTTKSFIEQ